MHRGNCARSARLASGVWSLVGCAGAAVAQVLPLNVQVVTGDAVPGTPGAVFASALGPPTISDSTDVVAFSAAIQGSGVTVDNDQGQWRTQPLGVLVRESAAAPWGGATTSFALGAFTLNSPIITNSVEPLLSTRLAGAGVTSLNDRCIALLRLAGPEPVIREGNAAPGLPAGTTIGDAMTFTPSAGNAFTIVTTLRGAGVTSANDTALWLGSKASPGSPALLAREGDEAPGLGVGAVYSSSILGSPVWVTASGVAAFFANVEISAVPTTVLYRGTPGALTPVLRTNDQVPGFPAGIIYQSFGAFNLTQNDVATVVFSATIAGPGITQSNNTGVWVNAGGVTTLVMLAGVQVPGLPAGVVFDRLADWAPIITNTGSFFFLTRLAGPGVTASNDTALMVFQNNQIRVAAREGDTIPGLPSNVALGEFSTTIYPQVNNRSQCVIQAALSGAVTTANDTALVGWDPVAGPVVVYREGEPVDVRGTLWTDYTFVLTQVVAASYGGRGVSISDNGTVAFSLVRPAGGPSAIVTATIPSGPVCDTIDFNRDTLTPDSGDLDDFLSVFAGGPSACSNFPNCGDIDFNNDSLEPDSTDLDAFISRLGGGPCLVP